MGVPFQGGLEAPIVHEEEEGVAGEAVADPLGLEVPGVPEFGFQAQVSDDPLGLVAVVSQGGEGLPRIALRNEAQVVEFEARGLSRCSYRPEPSLPSDLAGAHVKPVAAQGTAGRVVVAVSVVRSLEVAGRTLLGCEDGLRGAFDTAHHPGAGDFVTVTAPPVSEVDAAGHGVVGEEVRALFVQVPLHHGEDSPQGRTAGPEILLDSQDRVGGEGLDLSALLGSLEIFDVGGVHGGGDRLKEAQGPSPFGLAGDLEGRRDGYGLGNIGVAGVTRIPLGGTADPSGVEEGIRPDIGAPSLHVAATAGGVHSELVEAGPFDEEGSLLREVDLEGREVDEGRVGFDLAEVRVHGQVEGEVGGQAVLDVDPHIGVSFGVAGVGVLSVLTVQSALAEKVGEEFDLPGGGEALGDLEGPEEGDELRGALGNRGPVAGLSGAGDEALHLETPAVEFPGGVTELVEGDTELGAPPPGETAGGPIPDGFPAGIFLRVVVVVGVFLYARGVEGEGEGGPLVFEAVEPDGHVVAEKGVVFPTQEGLRSPRV